MSATHFAALAGRAALPIAALAVAAACAQAPPPGGPAAAGPHRDRWAWNRAQARVTATGDLQWAPEPYRFSAGKATRYIDFEAGSDANAGTSPGAAWKRHPWDPAATGQARDAAGADTYVFKRGVTYRGQLRPPAGAAGVRLASDPAWGRGDAVLAGSERVTGWTRGAGRPDIPDGDRVWRVDLPYAPRNVWTAGPNGVERVALARTPNWRETDPEEVHGEWWQWEQPEWWTNKHKIDFQGRRAHVGIDTRHLTREADYYTGAVLRTGYGIVMGTPFPTRVEGFDEQKKGLIFQGIWFGDSEQIITGVRYFLEDKPHYLDEPGEFWFDRRGEGGTLYARLPADRDPNETPVEVGRHVCIVEAGDLEDVAIEGLTFRFTNTHWDLTLAGWGHPDVANAAIRVRGAARNLGVRNCRFEHVAGRALVVNPGDRDAQVDGIVIADNDIAYTDHGAIQVVARGPGDVKVLRNRLRHIGARPHRQDHGHALIVEFPATMHVAGNILSRCYGAGLFLFGGKGSGETRDVPLARLLVHHNRAVDTLLAANDWGGIETWQGGPHYVYSNISGNPNGRWWAYDPRKPGSARLGLAYYHDGGFKVFNFNNVAWGNPVEATSPLRCYAAYYEAVPTIENSFVNNTAYAFHIGSNWSPAGGRHYMLGNLWMDISGVVFQHGQLKEDRGPAPETYPADTLAISRNVFHGISAPVLGHFEADGTGYPTVEAMRRALEARKPLAGDVGVVSQASPVRDAAAHDFRPAPGSAAIDRGVKAFVPWALARNVGEWHFRLSPADPTLVADSHWYLAPYYVHREDYHRAPTFPLRVAGATAAAYASGPLEDWTRGALLLDGRTRYARARHADMARPYTYRASGRGSESRTVAAADLATPDVGAANLLIEAYVRVTPGWKGGAVAGKMGSAAGYRLALGPGGAPELVLRAGGRASRLASRRQVNDGKWHHVLAEVDRAGGAAAIYVDGVRAAAGRVSLPAAASLSSAADLEVGRGLSGAIEYLRICRATLAESRTSIEELYAWQFDGPFLRDFAGRPVTGKRRDAGAFEAERP